MKATSMVHWPGKDTAACPDHLVKLVGLSAVLGFQLSWTPLEIEIECDNCASEAKKDESIRKARNAQTENSGEGPIPPGPAQRDEA